jgi:hypothetical protein
MDTVESEGINLTVHFFIFQGGSGDAHGMKFMNAKMNSVAKPVVIDQYYVILLLAVQMRYCLKTFQ